MKRNLLDPTPERIGDFRTAIGEIVYMAKKDHQKS